MKDIFNPQINRNVFKYKIRYRNTRDKKFINSYLTCKKFFTNFSFYISFFSYITFYLLSLLSTNITWKWEQRRMLVSMNALPITCMQLIVEVSKLTLQLTLIEHFSGINIIIIVLVYIFESCKWTKNNLFKFSYT